MIKLKSLAIMAMAFIVLANIDQINGQVCRVRRLYNQGCDNKLLSCDKKRGLVCDASLVCKCNTTNWSFDLKSGNCVPTCPPGSFPTVDKTCVTCENSTFFDSTTGKCSLNCSATFVPNSENKTCVCPPNSIYQLTTFQNNTNVTQCLSTCPSGLYPNDALKTCISCLSNQTYNTHLQECHNLCPSGSQVNTTTKACSCPNGQFLNRHTRRCETKCPTGVTADSRNTCSCPAFYNFADGTCVASCPNNAPNDASLKLCFTCPGTQLFTKHTLTCADSCVDSVMDRVSGVCLCPASADNFNPVTMKCNSTCGPNQLTNVFKTCTCPSTLPTLRLDNLNCVASCPAGFLNEPTLQICYSCATDKFLDKKTFTCTDTCPTGTFKGLISKTCATCSAPKTFLISATETCTDSCQASAGLVADAADKNLCVCPTLKPYLDTQTNECRALSGCSDRGLVISASPQTCKCPDTKPYRFGTQCVAKCLAFSTKDDTLKTCVQCLPTEYYDQSAEMCVSKCNASQITITELRLCVTCPTGQFFDLTTSKCVSPCPAGTEVKNNNLCVCSAPNQFIDVTAQKCTSACPSGTIADPVFKRCLTCSAPTPFFDPTINSCVDKCPNGLFTDSNRNTCVNCPNGYSYLIEVGICVAKCDAANDLEAFGTSCRCNTAKPYYNRFTGKCVDTCGKLDLDLNTVSCNCLSGYYTAIFKANNTIDTATETCSSTCAKNPFDLLKKCVTCTDNANATKFNRINLNNYECKECAAAFDSTGDICSCKATDNIFDRTASAADTCSLKTTCLAGKFLDPTTKTCNYCPTSNQFYFNHTNTCFDVCPTGTSVDVVSKTCFCPLGKFYSTYTSSCVDKCPTGVITSSRDDYKLCKCITNAFYRADTDTCVDSCAPLVPDLTSKKCVQCPLDKKFFLTNTQSCVSSCAAEITATADSQCTCPDAKSFYNIDKKACEATCDSSFVIDKLRKTCSCSGFYNPYTKLCVPVCPLGATVESGNICKCAKDFNQYLFQCVDACPATIPAKKDGDLSFCQCPTKTDFFLEKSLVCNATCAEVEDKSAADFPTCECATTLPLVSSANACASTCAAKEYPDPLSGRCLASCTIAGQFIVKTSPPKCASCPAGTTGDANTGRCDCSTGLFFDQATSKCVSTCPSNTFADATFGVCVDCKNYVFNKYSSTCVTSCPRNLVLDKLTRTCICSDSTKVYDFATETCK